MSYHSDSLTNPRPGESHGFWPGREEWRLLRGFYLAGGLTKLFEVFWPFQFAYLFLVMERPEWALLPLMAESGAALFLELPTGVVADRWGRKLSVLVGMGVSALALALVPLATAQSGTWQLAAVLACFAGWGAGTAFISGAREAWVVDNLAAEGRSDLVRVYFARADSFKALGTVGASGLGFLLLMTSSVSRALLDSLWLVGALGVILSLLVASSILEKAAPATAASDEPTGEWSALLMGFRIILRSPRLLLFSLALVAASFPEQAMDDAFDMAMLIRGMDARLLAPLVIVSELLGMPSPLIGLALARRFGTIRVLAWFALAAILGAGVMIFRPGLWITGFLYVALTFVDCVFDPLSLGHLQRLLPSSYRATATSTVMQLGGILELLGIGMFAMLLGEHSEEISESMPDLIEIFTGAATSVPQTPIVWPGLAVPDLAIVLFGASGLLSLPLLLWSATARKAEESRQEEAPPRGAG